MLFEGCQGRKGPEILEKKCPNCGAEVELVSGEVMAVCESCGFPVYTDLMDCAFRCPQARQCVGEEGYARLLEAKARWEETMARLHDDDTW